MTDKFRAWDKRLKIMTTDCGVMEGLWDCLKGHQRAEDQVIMQYLGNGIHHDDIVTWTHIFERSIEADYSSAELKVKLEFKGKITLSLHTGTWVTKMSRKATVLVNTFNKDYLGDKYDHLLQDIDGTGKSRIKLRKHWKLEVIGNVHQSPELLGI